MKKIKVAQIGTSIYSHGSQIWNLLKDMGDVFEVVGYALPEGERERFLHHMKFFEGYPELSVEEILKDESIEAVFIETEEVYLTKYALMAAKAGKHIHMEKPGGVGLSDFSELVGIMKEKGLVFSLGYMFRFNPAIRAAVEKARRGELGRIYSVEAQMSCYHHKEWRQWLKSFPGGMMFFLGCHLIDLVFRIQGEPREIIPLSTSTHTEGVNTTDYGFALFKYDDGISFVKTTDVEVGGGYRRQVVIAGERGTVEIRPIEEDIPGGKHYAVTETRILCDGKTETSSEKSPIFGRYDAMLLNFADMVRGKENPYSYDYELELYKLILKSCGEKI